MTQTCKYSFSRFKTHAKKEAFRNIHKFISHKKRDVKICKRKYASKAFTIEIPKISSLQVYYNILKKSNIPHKMKSSHSIFNFKLYSSKRYYTYYCFSRECMQIIKRSAFAKGIEFAWNTRKLLIKWVFLFSWKLSMVKIRSFFSSIKCTQKHDLARIGYVISANMDVYWNWVHVFEQRFALLHPQWTKCNAF